MSDSLRYARAMDYFGMIKAASQEIPKDTESLKVFAIQAEMAARQIQEILNEPASSQDPVPKRLQERP